METVGGTIDSGDSTAGIKKGQFVVFPDGGEVGIFLVSDIIQTIRGPTARLVSVRGSSTRGLTDVPLKNLKIWRADCATNLEKVAEIAAQDCLNYRSTTPSAAFYCRTKFMAYQFRPLLKYYDKASKRVLIADETGLGKTIEAGYIIAEEIARGDASRIVILCPSRLRGKWKRDMQQKIGVPFKIVGGRGLMEALCTESKSFFYIASFDCARNIEPAALDKMLPSQKLIDLLVIDEIHRMIGRIGDTYRRRLGVSLSRVSGGLIGMSATPVQIETDDLGRVMDIVAPSELTEDSFEMDLRTTGLLNRVRRNLGIKNWEDRMERTVKQDAERILELSGSLEQPSRSSVESFARRILSEDRMAEDEVRRSIRDSGADCTFIARHINRTKGLEVGENRKRIVKTIRIELNRDVRTAHRQEGEVSTSEYEYFMRLDGLFKDSFSHVHRQQLSSCLPAMLELLRLGESGYRSWRAREQDDDECGPKDRESASENEISDRCRELVSISGLMPRDSKFKELSSCLGKMRGSNRWRKAILFTHWRPTFRYLSDHVDSIEGIRFVKVPLDADDRAVEEAIRKFESIDSFAVLLTSDILREGFDLDAADVVINYDLSYNPQEMEQRIGRIDRVCQTSKEILIVNLIVKGSLDEIVYDRILSRIGTFEHAIGDMRPITEEMAEKLEIEGRIDESEIIREATRLDGMRRLMDHDAFNALEGALDDEIAQAHNRRSAKICSLNWTFMMLFFQMICPGCIARWDDKDHCLHVIGLTNEAEESIIQIAGQENRDMVEWTLSNSRLQNGEQEFRFSGGKDSVPMTDPLLLVAARTISNLFGKPSDNTNQLPCRLFLDWSDFGVSKEICSMLLIEFRFDGVFAKGKEIRLYGVARTGPAEFLKNLNISDILMRAIGEASAGPLIGDCQNPKEEKMMADFDSWKDSFERREIALKRVDLERKSRIINAMIFKLEEKSHRREDLDSLSTESYRKLQEQSGLLRGEIHRLNDAKSQISAQAYATSRVVVKMEMVED